ncbi:MAG: O-antigen ligase family protein, partial [Clostridium sp.]|nr:O-antigen ligase family protein [Clostridium sp.]
MENFKKFCKEKSITLFFPIAVILTIVPLIVRMKKVTVDPAAIKLVGETSEMDLFSQNKAFMLMVFCGMLIILSIIFFKDLFKKRDKITLASMACMAIFFIFSLISAVSSKYTQTAIWGYYDRAEGIVTIGCYLILFIYCIYAFRNTIDYKYITYPLMIVVFINAFLGMFQYFGSDLIKTNLGQLISIPSKYNIKASDLKLLFDDSKLYGTLFHYNYVGSFVAIVLPILFIAAVIEFEHVMYKVGLMFSCLLSIWLLFGSTSRAGLIGVAVSLIAGIIIFGKLVKSKWKPILIGFAVLCVLITGANFALGNKIFARMPSLASDVVSLFKSNDDFNLKDNVPIKDIQYKDNGGAVAVLQKDSLEFYVEDGQYIFKDSSGNNVDYTRKDNNLTTADSRFSNISFTYGKLPDANKSNGIYLNLNSKPAFVFKLSKNKLHLVDNNTLEDIELVDAESIGFNGKEKIGSARGYIWSRTLP